MKIKTYKVDFIAQVASVFDQHEAESLFYIVLDTLHHLKRIDMALQPDLEMTNAQQIRWNEIKKELLNQKPIQYILGETEFFGLPFKVNQSTLIPRSETEELVALILKNNSKQTKNLKILDIGTGSGCIAVSLAKNCINASVFALDVSTEALQIAKINAQENKVEVVFLNQNILETQNLNQQFDVIVSNPPYVRHLEKTEIDKNVLDFEPHLALFVADDDALLFYRKIAELALINLTDEGQLFFEINQYLSKEMVLLLESYHFKNIQLIKDVYQNDRIICCTLR